MNISDLLKYPELAEIPKLREQIKDIINDWDKDDEVFEIRVNNPHPSATIIEEANEKLSEDDLYEIYDVFNSTTLVEYWEEVNDLIRKNFEIINEKESIDYTIFELTFDSLNSNEEIVNDLSNLDSYLEELIQKQNTPIEERILDFKETINEIKRGLEEFKRREKRQKYLKQNLEDEIDSLYNAYSDLFDSHIKYYLD
jgi:hypothetical protein